MQERKWLRDLGFGFAVFGFGLNVVLRVAPMVGYQPSFTIAVTLVAFGLICMLGGLLIIAASLVPGDARVRVVGTRAYIVSHATFLLPWILGIVVVLFVSWQSWTIYRFQEARAKHEWAVPSSDDQRAFTKSLKALGSHPLAISCGDDDCEALSEALTAAAKDTKTWSIQNYAGGMDAVGLVGTMLECPPGQGNAFPKQLQTAIQDVLHIKIPLYITSMQPPTCDFVIGRKPRS